MAVFPGMLVFCTVFNSTDFLFAGAWLAVDLVCTVLVQFDSVNALQDLQLWNVGDWRRRRQFLRIKVI